MQEGTFRAAMTAIATASALAAAACASSAPQNALSGTRWAVESIGGAPAAGATIEFSAERVAGAGGCNRFFGGYAVSGESISFNDVGSTRMACAPEIMARETAFFGVLNSAQRYARIGDRLEITASDGAVLSLRAQ